MQKVRFIKDYDGKSKGSIMTVSNNEAHRLIEIGAVVLDNSVVYPDKMMTSRSYKSKKRK